MIYGSSIEEIDTKERQSISHVSQSPTVRKMKIECPHVGGLVLWFLTWSDDFDPRNTKMNLGSVWIKTITISIPSTGLKPRGYTDHTYVVSLGDSKSDHDAIEIKFQEDLKKFQRSDSVYFYPRLNSHVQVYMKPAAIVQDRPERSKHCAINGHAGTFTRRWRYIANVDLLKDILPACPTCEQELEKSRITNGCAKCANWNFDPKDTRLASPTNKDYPFDVDFIPVNQITKQGLKQSAKLAHDFVSSGEWTSKAVTNAYMKTKGHNDSTVNEVYDRAKNIFSLEKARKILQNDDQSQMSQSMSNVIQKFNDDPSQFQPYTEPATWNSELDMVNYPDAMMHMVFLGVVRDLLEIVTEWLNFHGYMKTFKQKTLGMYESIQKLRLSWCKIMPFQDGRYTGWLSENYLPASRLMSWLFQMIPDNETTKKEHIEHVDQSQVSKWKTQDCIEWANKHNVIMSDCKLVKNMRNRVLNAIKTPEKFSKAAVPTYLIKNAIHSTSVFVSTLFAKEVNNDTIHETNIAVRLFLSKVNALEQAMSKTRSKKNQCANKVFDTGNFLSCLNITDTMKELGPPTNLYEGGISGEGIIPYVKKAFQSGHGIRGNSMVNALMNFYRSRSIERLTRPFSGKQSQLHHVFKMCDPDNSDEEDDKDFSMDFYEALVNNSAQSGLDEDLELNKLSKSYDKTHLKYDNKKQVSEQMNMKMPISFLCKWSGEIFLCLKDGSFLQVLPGQVQFICCGLKYHSVIFKKYHGTNDVSTLTPGLMLPFREQETESTFYSFVNRDYLHISDKMNSFKIQSFQRLKGENEA